MEYSEGEEIMVDCGPLGMLIGAFIEREFLFGGLNIRLKKAAGFVIIEGNSMKEMNFKEGEIVSIPKQLIEAIYRRYDKE